MKHCTYSRGKKLYASRHWYNSHQERHHHVGSGPAKHAVQGVLAYLSFLREANFLRRRGILLRRPP